MLNYIDFAFIIITGVSIAFGLFRGMVKEVLSLTFWGLAFWVSIFHANIFAESLSFIETDYLRYIAARSGSFFAIILLGSLITFGIVRMVRVGSLGSIDRVLGGFFGFARGALIVIILAFIMQFTPATEFESWHNSKLLGPISSVTDYITENLPEDWQKDSDKDKKKK